MEAKVFPVRRKSVLIEDVRSREALLASLRFLFRGISVVGSVDIGGVLSSKSQSRLRVALEAIRHWGELAAEAILMGNKLQLSGLCDQNLVMF